MAKNKNEFEMEWTPCSCGHLAQDHNSKGKCQMDVFDCHCVNYDGKLIRAVEFDAKNVFDYFQEVYGVSPKKYGDKGTTGLKEYPIRSYCGEVCRHIIDKGQDLLKICDTHPDVVENIHKGILTAIEVVCFG